MDELMGEFRPSITGFFGKLPARGDFVRASLPEDFVAPLDNWCRATLSASRQALGEGWEQAWMNAPVWRFLLPPGACGPSACCGAWLPSVDKVGRQYPFILCALAPSVSDLETGGDWCDAAEDAGLAGVVDDLPLEAITEMLKRTVQAGAPQPIGWWTMGSPFVKPRRFDISALLPEDFAGAMLRDQEPVES
jgi:type VI secretion system protein ImpM